MKYSFEQVQDIFCCIRCPLYNDEEILCQHEDCVHNQLSEDYIFVNKPYWCPLNEE